MAEVKANERVPCWVTDLTARMDMAVIRVSKYCQSVQAFGLVPRSRLGAPELIVPSAGYDDVPTDLLSSPRQLSTSDMTSAAT